MLCALTRILKMSKHLICIICLSVLILGNYSLKEKEISKESKMQMLYDLMPTLFDSVFIDIGLAPPPPPPPWEMTKNDSILYKKIYEDYLVKQEQRSDTLLLVIQDSLLKIDNPIELIKKNYNITATLTLDPDNSGTNKIDFDKILLPKRFILRPSSIFPSGTKIWESNYDYELAGIYYVSNVEFDSTKTYGIIKWGFMCGRLCGHGGYAFIINKEGKWIIDRISIDWIS